MLFLPWVASTQAVRNDLSRSLLTCILILYRVIWYLSYIDILVYTWWIAILYIFMLNKFYLSPESWVLSYDAVNFPQNIHERHPIARPLGQGMGCLMGVQLLIDIQPQFLQWYVQYHAILVRGITAFDCIMIYFMTALDRVWSNIHYRRVNDAYHCRFMEQLLHKTCPTTIIHIEEYIIKRRYCDYIE